MRGGLPSHPSLEPCSESLSWSQPTGLNCPAEESLQLGASHTPIVEKHPWPRVPPPLQEGAIMGVLISASQSPLGSDWR